MTENTSLPSRPDTLTRPPVNWPLVFGLGSLALLWPLAQLTGLSDAIGPLPTVLLHFAVVFAVWVGVVGLAGVPRPVLTLTLAGVAYGAFLIALSVVLGDRPQLNGVLPVVAALFEIGRSALLGSLAGLLALGVQNLVRRR